MPIVQDHTAMHVQSDGSRDGRFPDFERPEKVLSATRRDITWTFNQPAHVNQFINGDPQVLAEDGLEVVAISPAWDGIKHGSMVDVTVNPDQGFDTRMQSNTYSAANNAATGNIACSAEKSILSSKSYTADAVGHDPQLESIEVLTVVSQMKETFRPGYSGSDKSLRFVEADLDYSELGSFSKTNITNAPDISTLADSYSAPIIEYMSEYIGRYTHPANNMPTYGREIGYWADAATLSLQLDYTDAEKRDLLINVVQMAIDLHSAIENGMSWIANGGHNQGRKGLYLLGAKVLNNSAMLANCDAAANQTLFQEDGQIFTVSQSDVDLPRYTTDGRQRDPYTTEMIGLSEWGEKHYTQPNRDGSNWNAYYRDIANSATIGSALLAYLLSAKTDWNNPAFFDYYENRKWLTDEALRGTSNQIQLFTASVWDEHGAT